MVAQPVIPFLRLPNVQLALTTPTARWVVYVQHATQTPAWAHAQRHQRARAMQASAVPIAEKHALRVQLVNSRLLVTELARIARRGIRQLERARVFVTSVQLVTEARVTAVQAVVVLVQQALIRPLLEMQHAQVVIRGIRRPAVRRREPQR